MFLATEITDSNPGLPSKKPLDFGLQLSNTNPFQAPRETVISLQEMTWSVELKGLNRRTVQTDLTGAVVAKTSNHEAIR